MSARCIRSHCRSVFDVDIERVKQILADYYVNMYYKYYAIRTAGVK